MLYSLDCRPSGTGKSVLLREIIIALRKKYETRPDAVAVTASTGIAACNVGGVTLHSFAGIGLGIEPADKLYVLHVHPILAHLSVNAPAWEERAGKHARRAVTTI